MRHFQLAFRSLFKRGQNNIIKILSLGVGLAMGLVLISKVYFEMSYDDFYPDAENIYQIHTIGKAAEDEFKYGQVSGGIAPAMSMEIPQIDAATRFTSIPSAGTFYTVDKKPYSFSKAVLGDSCLFDVLPRPMIVGNPKEALSRPMQVLLSRSVAEKIAHPQDIIGKSIIINEYPGKELFIGGVFEDIPENTHYHYDFIVSMPSIEQFMWDGSMNFIGNDRYFAYVKFLPGVNPENLQENVQRMQEKYQDLEMLKEMGVEMSYTFEALLKLHKEMPEVKRMLLMLALLAFAVIFTAMMNYILIVISSMVNRTKDIAVDKCYGAKESDIAVKMMVETFVHLIFSLIIAASLIIIFRETIEELLSSSLSALFSFRSILLLISVCLSVFFITAIFPAKIISRTPVLSALRGYKESKRTWKLILLFFQFTAAAFLITLLAIIGRQYNTMVNDNPGYSYENTLYTDLSGVDQEEKQRVINELKTLSEVQAVASAYELPITAGSGNNILLPGKNEELFNIVDLYNVDADYLSLMEIPITEGRGFDKNSAPNEMIVSSAFADRLLRHTNWTDGVVGKQVFVTEHGECSIVGVYPNIRVASIADPENRPSAMFFTNRPGNFILAKLNQITPENLQKTENIVQNILPERDIVIRSYKLEMLNAYNSSRLFRNAVMIGGIVTLIISLIGLIGYTGDEVNRRRKEIAIRKINGAKIREIQELFSTDVLKIAFPAMIIGSIATLFTANKWMENFSEKTDMSVLLFAVCIVILLALILAVILIGTYRAALKNPADTIKTE